MPNSSRTASATSSASPAPARSRARTVGSCRSFVHERPRQVHDAFGDDRFDVAELAQDAFDLARANRLRLPAQLRQQRLDLELAIPAAEGLHLLLEDPLDHRHLGEASSHCAVEADAQIVDVEEPDSGNLARRAFDVRGHGQVDDDERTLRTACPSPRRSSRREDRGLGRGRRDDDVRVRERVLELGQRRALERRIARRPRLRVRSSGSRR